MTKITKKAAKLAVLDLLAESDDAVRVGILELAARQTEDELLTKDTKWKNKRGFSSSNAHWGTKYAETYSAGGTLEGDDLARARRICVFHAKQLAEIAWG